MGRVETQPTQGGRNAAGLVARAAQAANSAVVDDQRRQGQAPRSCPRGCVSDSCLREVNISPEFSSAHALTSRLSRCALRHSPRHPAWTAQATASTLDAQAAYRPPLVKRSTVWFCCDPA